MSTEESNKAKELSMDEVFLGRIKDYVLRNISRDQFSFELLSSEIGYSRSQINRKLKKITDKSLSTFVREIRLEEAFKLLKARAGTASDIAYRTGFSSPAYFNQCFHSYFGITPGEVSKQKGLTKGADPKAEKTKKIIVENGWAIASYITILLIIGFMVVYIIGEKQRAGENNMKKSVAVLPFYDFSQEPCKEYICEGLTGEIISNLYKIESFDVVPSLTSVLKYKNSGKDIKEIAEELQVNYVLECQYKRIEDTLRFSFFLIEAKSGRHIWQNDYHEAAEMITGIPADIAFHIADQLNTVITNSEKSKIRTIYTTNSEAYNLYLQANYLISKGRQGKENFESSIDLLQEAIAMDPDFALAYSALASSYLRLYWFNWDESEGILAGAKGLIENALRIDPELAEAYIEMAHYYYHGLLDYANALDMLDKANKIMPGHYRISYLKALIYRRMGKWEESLQLFQESLENNPRSQETLFNMAETYFFLRRYQEALEIFEAERMTDPANKVIYISEMIIYILRDGNTRYAEKILEESEKVGIKEDMLRISLFHNPISMNLYKGELEEALDYLSRSDWPGHFNMLYYHPRSLYKAWIYDLMNLQDKADIYFDATRKELDSLLSIFPDDPRYYGAMGLALAGLGEEEMAIDYAKQAVQILPIEKDAYKGLARIEELARVYVMLDEYDAAIQQIEILLSKPGPYSVPKMKLDPKWKPLWYYPGFIRLTERYSLR